jgi:hypothetical protein
MLRWSWGMARRASWWPSWPPPCAGDYPCRRAPGGIGASGGLLQRRLGLPDATVLVLQGILFVVILASETLRERLQRMARVAS